MYQSLFGTNISAQEFAPIKPFVGLVGLVGRLESRISNIRLIFDWWRMGPARGQDARPWGKKSSRKRKGSQQSLETDHPERIPVHPPQLDQSCPPHGAGTRGVTTSFGDSLGTESPSIAPKPPHLDQTCCKDLDAEELPHKAFPCQDEASHPDKRGEKPQKPSLPSFFPS